MSGDLTFSASLDVHARLQMIYLAALPGWWKVTQASRIQTPCRKPVVSFYRNPLMSSSKTQIWKMTNFFPLHNLTRSVL